MQINRIGFSNKSESYAGRWGERGEAVKQKHIVWIWEVLRESTWTDDDGNLKQKLNLRALPQLATGGGLH